MGTTNNVTPLPRVAGHVLSKLAIGAANDAPLFTMAELKAALSATMDGDEVEEGIGHLVVRRFVQLDHADKRRVHLMGEVETPAPVDKNYVDPAYVQFVENLFKEFRRVPGPEAYDAQGSAPVTVLDYPATFMHAAIGMAGEAGELLDTAKKTWVYNKPFDATNAVEELGDMFFYFVKAVRLCGLTLQDVVAFNQAKLLRRFPGGVYSDQHAQARADKSTSS